MLSLTRMNPAAYILEKPLSFYVVALLMSCFCEAVQGQTTKLDDRLVVPRNNPFDMPFERSDITLLNWQHWPYSRYASHHPTEFLRMAVIKADPDAAALARAQWRPIRFGFP